MEETEPSHGGQVQNRLECPSPNRKRPRTLGGDSQGMAELDKKWHQQYEKLVELERQNGHCIVPKRYEQDKALGQWVSTQRTFHTKNKLRPDRKELLDKIGFVWNAGLAVRQELERIWHQQHDKLVDFKRKNGHCIVPSFYAQDYGFGEWVHRQRSKNKNNKLRPNRKELLDKIGFAWTADSIAGRVSGEDQKWHQQHEKLVDFKQKNGHCVVPRLYKEDKAFGRWVAEQRANNKINKMRLDRKELLDKIGFLWKADTVAARRIPTTDGVSSGLVIG
jgi:hypothetical protein